MSKVRIVLWDEPTGREEVVETIFTDADEAWAHYESGNGSCECNRAFADEVWDGGEVPVCGFGQRWVLDMLKPNGEPMGSPDGHLLAMPPRETPSDAFEASPAFRAKMAERETLLRAATGTTNRCDRCFAFYSPARSVSTCSTRPSARHGASPASCLRAGPGGVLHIIPPESTKLGECL